MERQELLNAIAEIGTCSDDAERRELLTSLRENLESDYDRLDQLTTDNATLTQNNEKLRSANMQLFLRVGESKTQDELMRDETGTQKKPEKRRFEDLFNEKGGLK